MKSNWIERREPVFAFGYIIKPFEDKDLYTAIEIALFRHEMESKLKEKEEKLRKNLIDNTHDAIYIIAPYGFQYANPAFEKLTGWKNEELRNRKFNFWNIVHPNDKKLIMEKAKKGGKEEQSSYEFRIIKKDGEERTVGAMSSHQPYRPALGKDKAMEEISQNKGVLYDPKVVDACLKVLSKNKVNLV